MKKLIQIIYGMQYEELQQQGKDGNKARLNGSLFLSAYIIIAIFLILMLLSQISEYNEALTKAIRRVFGSMSGKGIGKLLAITLFAAIYFIVSKTWGSESKFKEYVHAYLNFPAEEKKKSALRALGPFFAMLVLMLVLAFI